MNGTEGAMSSVVPIISSLIAFFLGLFVDRLKQWLFGAKLSLGLATVRQSRFVLWEEKPGPDGKPVKFATQAKYARVFVENKRATLARTCRAYLTNVEFYDQNQWEPTEFADTLLLEWSASPNEVTIKGLDVPKGAKFHVDVFRTLEEPREDLRAPLYRFTAAVTPLRYNDLLSKTGRYKLTIVVGGDVVTPKTIEVILDWRGNWDDFQVTTSDS
jgi:hypothetical protein